MKLAIILWAVALLQVSAATYAQKINLNVKSTTLDRALDKIRRQSGYNFLYNSKMVKTGIPVTVSATDQSLNDVLVQVFKDQPLVFIINGNTVVIRKKDNTLKENAVIALISVSGTVTDTKGQPLPGVSVKIKGTTAGTMTGVDGKYSIKVADANSVLIFSSVGFTAQEVSVNNNTQINVTLKDEPAALNEIVVVGYGTQKKVDLTGSVSSISGDELNIKPVGQTSAALEGVAPGVTVKQSSGRPGGDAGSIRIRGIGTLSNANPLTLIDGVEGSIDNIDPNVIESVSVLKDAASSAIYGSRAANGVILVTTKRAGSKMSIQYSNYLGWQKPTNMPDVVDAVDHMVLLNQAYVNAGRTPLYSDALITAYRSQNGVSSDKYPNTDWQKETLTGSGFQQSHFVNINSGSDKVRTLTSIGYYDQKGIIQTSDFKRYTIRNNADITFSKQLSLKVDLQFVDAITQEPGVGSGTVFTNMDGIPANQIGINSNGSWGVGWNGSNPIAETNDGGRKITTAPFGSLNATLNYQPFKWLKAEFTAAPKYAEVFGDNFNKAIQTYLPTGASSYLVPSLSSLTNSTDRAMYNTFRAMLTAQKSFGSHDLKVLVGASDEDYSDKSFSAYRDTYILPDFPIINAGSAANQQTSGTAEAWALRSYFGRVNYDYQEKYLLELNGRYDGSSRFTENHRYAFFPSASAGWRISEEEFMKPLKSVVDELKLRASWGRLGNQNIGTYPSTTSVALGISDLGKQIVSVAALNALANKDITWETTEMSDVGVDMTLFSKLNITADYYFRRTTGILLQLNIPLLVGLAAPTQNAGIVNNKGWELGMGYRGNINEFKYGINFNLSDVVNKVIDLHGINQTGTTVNREGYSIGSLYGFQAEGLFKDAADIKNHAAQFGVLAPGDVKYKDQNNDGIINDKDKVILGGTIPRYTFGSTINGSYKGFDFNIFIQGVGNTNGYLSGPGFQPFAVTGIGGTILEEFKDSWTPQNTSAKYPRLVFGGTNNAQVSSYWVRSAAYARLKNIQLGYTLPVRFSNKIGMKSLRIFANGSNLFTSDNFWKGFDVESPIGDVSSYPQVKVYSLGLNANF